MKICDLAHAVLLFRGWLFQSMPVIEATGMVNRGKCKHMQKVIHSSNLREVVLMGGTFIVIILKGI